MWAHHFTKAVWRVFQADLKEAHHPQNPSTPPHKKLSTNAPHFPQMRSARGALTNETAELLLWADTDQSTWSPHVHNPVEKKTQMCCAHAAPSSRSEQSAQTSAVQSSAARKRAQRAGSAAQSSCAPAASTAALLSSELHKYDWLAAAPSTKYEWLIWRDGAPGKEQFF